MIKSETGAISILVIILRISDIADQPMNITTITALVTIAASKPRNAPDKAHNQDWQMYSGELAPSRIILKLTILAPVFLRIPTQFVNWLFKLNILQSCKNG